MNCFKLPFSKLLTLVTFLLFTFFGFAQVSETYLTPGTYSYTVPSGITNIQIKAWGAGGGGANGTSDKKGIGGGGAAGGGFVGGTLSVNTGDIITIVVGQGGSGGDNEDENGVNGESTIISLNGIRVIEASGGAAGLGTNSGGNAGSNYIDSGYTSFFNEYSGGNGGSATNHLGGGGGGAAGTISNGEDGEDGEEDNKDDNGEGGQGGNECGGTGGNGTHKDEKGGDGTFPGGGGAGAGHENTLGGGTGANGAVIFGVYDCNSWVTNLNFDGDGDYINLKESLVSDKAELTCMAWIKVDGDSKGNRWIMGESSVEFKLENGGKIKAKLKTSDGDIEVKTTGQFHQADVWEHVAFAYSSTGNYLRVYINGELDDEIIDADKSGTIDASNTNFEIGRKAGGGGKNGEEEFVGAICEVKVFNIALSEEEIQEQVYQQIENNDGLVYGKEVPKAIGNLQWENLLLYVPLSEDNGIFNLSDLSLNKYEIELNDMDSAQKSNAPLPYVADSIGVWTNVDTWQHGDVWDIEDIGTPRPWSIIKMEKSSWIPAADTLSFTIDQSMQLFGLKLMDKTKFIVNGSIDITTGAGVDLVSAGDSLYVSDYLLLDGGILDLAGESQLFQDSDALNEALNGGFMERDQQGTLDKFTYNYWSSPVHKNYGTTPNDYPLVDKYYYTVDEVFPDNVKFTSSGYNGSVGSGEITLADYWIWKFNNKLAGQYSQWQHMRRSGNIIAGEGFTLKGPGSGVLGFQNYSFQGIPNNGTITLDISDGNAYLVGNPYPSALDAEKFIFDNQAVLENVVDGSGGTLLFWEHWGGGNHNLKDYQGGYGYYSAGGGAPAVSHANVSTIGDGTKTPGRYIPVGQGFYVTAAAGIPANSQIEFNNGQRRFITEVNQGNSWFMKSDGRTEAKNEGPDTRMKIRLGVDMPKGYHRQLLVTVDSRATESIDYGFEAKLADDLQHDMFWVLDEKKFVIQGLPTINKNTEVPIGFSMKSAGTMKIGIDELENVPENTTLFIKEIATGETFELSENVQFEVYLDAGTHNNKFTLVFHPKLVSEDEMELNEGMSAYLNNNSSEIHISKLIDTDILKVELFNINGQLIQEWDSNLNANELILPANLISGVYLLRIESEKGVYSKKLLKN